MLKKLFFTCIVGLSALSLIKPGQLKKIIDGKITLEVEELLPGQEFNVGITTTLRDSTKLHSQTSNFTINFSDYEFEMLNGVELIQKSRTVMTLRVSENSYLNPFVELKIKLRRKGEINHFLRIPIRYDLTQRVVYHGEDGFDPRSTTENGYRKIPIAGRVNVEFIDNEQTLTNNSDPAIIGGKGPNLEVFVSVLDTMSKAFIRVKIIDEFGGIVTKTLIPEIGQLEIESIGGKGGISRSGGKGGDGGDVTVYLSPRAKPYFDQVFILNYGGEGGELWRPKVDGQKRGPYGNEGSLKIIEQ